MDPSETAAELAAEYNSIFLSNHCSDAAAVVLIWEYFITISEEAKYFWKRKLTGASAIFFLNRYVPLILYVLDFAGYASMSDERFATPPLLRCPMHFLMVISYSCTGIGKFDSFYSLLQYVLWAAFSGSRAFALTNQNWLISLLVFGLSLGPLVVNLIRIHYGLIGEIMPLIGCIQEDPTPQYLAKRLIIVSRTSIIAADSLLVLITWFSLFRKDAKHRLTLGTATLAEVLLRDGTIYFIILVILNTLHLAFSFASFAVPALQNASDMAAFNEPITAILVQRFLFHLQAANRRTLGLNTSQMGSGVQWSSSLTFNRVIGSLGASIPPEDFLGPSEDDIDEVEDGQEGEMGSQPEDI